MSTNSKSLFYSTGASSASALTGPFPKGESYFLEYLILATRAASARFLEIDLATL